MQPKWLRALWPSRCSFIAMHPTSEKWSNRLGSELTLSEWADGVTVYHSASGETHYLNEVSAELIRVLREAPLGLESLVEEMAPGLSSEELVTLTRQTRAVLLRLTELGLADRHGAERGG